MQSPKHKTVYREKTYESYILRRVKMSLGSLPWQHKKAFAKQFQCWVDNNGKAYTVSRLKDIKQILLLTYSHYKETGEYPTVSQSNLTSTIALRRGGKVMAGYLGELTKLSMQSDKVFEQFIKLINAYTLLVDEETTPDDIKNLVNIIEPRPEQQHQDYIDQFCLNINAAKVRKFYFEHLKAIKFTSEKYCVSNYGNPMVRTYRGYKNKLNLLREPIGDPIPYALTQPMQDHENDNFFFELVSFGNSTLARDIYEIYPELWDNCFPYACDTGGLNPFYTVGKMALLNEGGLKKRWVENTKYIFQYILQPLGSRLYDLVKYSPWDCTFDENKGIIAIQNRLKQGLKCYSVDLSKATDKIPMDYNVAVLSKLLGGVPDAKKHIETFNLIARAHVQLPDISKNYPVESQYDSEWLLTRWGTGQPMGAYPSFATLSLVHGILLFILNNYQYDNSFVVHGDDVVILCDDLKEKYVDFLLSSGMEYSPYKTIESTVMAEMNSKIILADKVLTPVKWKEINATNCIDMAEFWGVDCVSTLAQNKRITKEQIIDVLSLPYPLGANLNPKGLTLEERLKFFPGLIESLLEESEDHNYIGSYRELVLQRYSKFATVTIDGIKQLDYAWYQSMLRDLELADIADKQCALSNLNLIPILHNWYKTNGKMLHINTFGVTWGFINHAFLSGNCVQKLNKVSCVALKSRNKKKAKWLDTRLSRVTKFHVNTKHGNDSVKQKNSKKNHGYKSQKIVSSSCQATSLT